MRLNLYKSRDKSAGRSPKAEGNLTCCDGAKARRKVEIQRKSEGGNPNSSVAQICNLLYRRFVIGRAHIYSGASGFSEGPQNAILRYSRLQICATEYFRPSDFGF